MKRFWEHQISNRLTEGMPNGMIASFDQPDDPEFEMQVYKTQKGGYYMDAGNWDDEAKNKAELMKKLKKYGIDIKRPNFGKIS